jgi:hypothetical protein
MWQSPRDDFKDHLHGECRTKFLEDNVSKELKMFHLEKAQGITLRTTPREHRTKSLDDNASKELKMVFFVHGESNLLAQKNGGPKVGCVQCGPKLQD